MVKDLDPAEILQTVSLDSPTMGYESKVMFLGGHSLHQENIDFTYRALSVLNTAYCDLMMFLSPIKQKVSKPDRA